MVLVVPLGGRGGLIEAPCHLKSVSSPLYRVVWSCFIVDQECLALRRLRGGCAGGFAGGAEGGDAILRDSSAGYHLSAYGG